MPNRPVTHRDQVHGDTTLDPLSVALLNTEPLQRLGRVYQLGYAHLVYRGGTHTRLSHVMGAAHVAGRIVDALKANYVQPKSFWPRHAISPQQFLPRIPGDDEAKWSFVRYVTRWAALLHDIGHIPLGHTLEDEFDRLYPKHDDFASVRIPFLWYEPDGEAHIRRILMDSDLYPDAIRRAVDERALTAEDVWASVLIAALYKEKRPDATRNRYEDFGALLRAFLANEETRTAPPSDPSSVGGASKSHLKFLRIVQSIYSRLRTSGIFYPFLADIVGNTVCADYLDYLRRDAANVGLDILRDDRVVSQFYVGQDGDDPMNLRMALALVDRRGKDRLDTCTGVVELVEQRFRFAEIIYYHKTKVAASAMFAKALALMNVEIAEVRPQRPELTLERIDYWIEKWRAGATTAARRETLSEFVQEQAPNALLDVEIGDESLALMLQHRVFEALEADLARDDPDFAAVTRRVRGLRLLNRIARRRLHKVALMIDAATFRELSPGSKVDTAVEKRLAAFVEKWRGGHKLREKVEQHLSDFSGRPDAQDAFIIYVPGRKVQAKGIETFAIDRNGIVTLGEHSAVQAKVDELSRDYRNLWRLVMFVDPAVAADAVRLSRVCDELLRTLWPGLSLGRDSVVQAIRTAAWFYYVHRNDETAFAAYVNLVKAMTNRPLTARLELPDALDWVPFEDVRTGAALWHSADRLSGEHADRAALLYWLRRSGVAASVHETIQRRIEGVSFSALLDLQLATPSRARSAARLGGGNPDTRASDQWVEVRRRAIAIQAYAENQGDMFPLLTLVT